MMPNDQKPKDMQPQMPAIMPKLGVIKDSTTESAAEEGDEEKSVQDVVKLLEDLGHADLAAKLQERITPKEKES